MASGYSVDIEDHFDMIFARGNSNVGTAQSLLQLTHRVRNPKQNVIHLCASTGVHSAPQTRSEIARSLLNVTLQSQKENESQFLQDLGSIRTKDGKATFEPKHPEHFDLFCDVLAYERQNGGKRGGSQLFALADKLKDEGAEFKFWKKSDELEDLQNRFSDIKLAKEEIADKFAEEVSKSEILDFELFANFEPSSPEEELSLHKTLINEFYGKSDLDTIKKDRGGKNRKRLRRFGRFLIHQDRPEIIREMDSRTARGGAISHTEHEYVKITSAKKLLKTFGFDLSEVLERIEAGDPTYEFEAKPTALLAQYLLAKRSIIERCGWTLPKDFEENPGRFFSTILSTYGIDLKSKKRKKNGKVITVRVLELDQIRVDLEDSNKWRLDRIEKMEEYISEREREAEEEEVHRELSKLFETL